MVLKHPLYLVRGTSTSGREPDLYTHAPTCWRNTLQFSYVCTRPGTYRMSECEHLNLRNPAFISARCRKPAQQCACQHVRYRILKIRQRCLHRVTVFRRSRICSNVDFLPKVVWCYAILYCTWVRVSVLSPYFLISGFSRMHPPDRPAST